MKNKIKKFSKGDFRTVHPEIVLPVTNLEMTIGEGESCQGSFILKNRKEGDIRGLVYSSSFRIHLEEQGFEGNPVELRFTYDGSGLAPGHVELGKFTIVCNGGEFEVNLTTIIEKPSVETSCGRVQNIRDFKRLAMENFIEAHRLFRSRDFYDVIKYEEPRINALYDNKNVQAIVIIHSMMSIISQELPDFEDSIKIIKTYEYKEKVELDASNVNVKRDFFIFYVSGISCDVGEDTKLASKA